MTNGKARADLQFWIFGTGPLAVAVISWGLFISSVLSTGSEEYTLQSKISQLRQQIETVTAERDQQARANEQKILAGQDLNTILVRVEAATEELQQLNSLRASVSQAIEQARLHLTGPSDPPAAMPESPIVGTTSSVRLSKQEIRAAQEALVDFGYGKLKADGSLGPSTRKAVTAFERAKGLPVTGRLGSTTLQALRTHTASVTQ
jgi:peptidoglycan hydrolase-like protein with peptidoglycan-binding domain